MLSPIASNKIVFQFPGDQSYEFKIRETNEFFNTTGKEQTRYVFNTEISLLYRTLDSTKEECNVGVRFLKVEMSNDIGDDNNKEASLDPLYQGLKAFDGATFKVFLNPQGEVAGISGFEDFKRKFMDLYNVASGEPSEAQVAPWFTESFFLDIFDHISNILCSNSVVINSTWEKMEADGIGAEKNIKNIYRCDEIRNGIAYISSSNEVNEVSTNHNTSMPLHGSIQGKYELDATTGILIKSKRCIEMSGSTKVHGIDLGMFIRKTITIDGKRVSDIKPMLDAD